MENKDLFATLRKEFSSFQEDLTIMKKMLNQLKEKVNHLNRTGVFEPEISLGDSEEDFEDSFEKQVLELYKKYEAHFTGAGKEDFLSDLSEILSGKNDIIKKETK